MRKLYIVLCLIFAYSPARAVVQSTLMGDANLTLSATTQNIVTTSVLTAPRTIFLPAAAGTLLGQSGASTYYQNCLSFFDQVGGVSSTNTIKFLAASSDTINGSSSLTISNPNLRVTMCPVNGEGWYASISPQSSISPSGPAGGDLSGTYPNPTVIQSLGNFAVKGTTASTSSTTGALTVAGGTGVAGAVNAGDVITSSVNAIVGNNASYQLSAVNSNNGSGRAGLSIHNTNGGGSLTFQQDAAGTGIVQNSGTNNFIAWYDSGGNNYLTFFGGASLASTKVVVNSTQASTSSTTGALTVAGGLGVSGSVYVAGAVGTGLTTVAGLPTCNAANEGLRHYVTDQATAVAYRGAVTGGGTTRQAVLCSNSTWIQD